MREFFRAIAKTTDRPDQWKQREAFWIAYLDEGLVTDAWPALGSRAKYQIDSLIRQSGERPEYGQIRGGPSQRSEEHTSELQSLMRISYAVFCLKKKQKINNNYSKSST